MLLCEYVQKLILIFNFAECASKVPMNLTQLLGMAICSKFYSTAEVLAAVLESNDEDLFEKDIGFMRPSVENVNNLYSHAEKFIS